jgi:hypothetical protein
MPTPFTISRRPYRRISSVRPSIPRYSPSRSGATSSARPRSMLNQANPRASVFPSSSRRSVARSQPGVFPGGARGFRPIRGERPRARGVDQGGHFSSLLGLRGVPGPLRAGGACVLHPLSHPDPEQSRSRMEGVPGAPPPRWRAASVQEEDESPGSPLPPERRAGAVERFRCPACGVWLPASAGSCGECGWVGRRGADFSAGWQPRKARRVSTVVALVLVLLIVAFGLWFAFAAPGSIGPRTTVPVLPGAGERR